ncbi:hypothetical protein [Arcanobacterium hippocoleae]|uniref:Uncharacterized protein n=1 Tax=Arcanobacterium hippocoleae TaxID=149017 RepID=A0ABU1T099_9ACTO|nr:hypothetical protein [Arcanobacterium hippocoleae]MDR6938719.1 hypothetical protein [Arcanobacterium hippocoleae]
MLNPKILFKIMTVAGPAVFKIVRKYGPQLRELYEKNPEVFQRLTNKMNLISKARKDDANAESLAKRVAILREQVTYLYASANTPEAAQRARKWRTELSGIEKSLPLLEAMAKKAQKVELKVLNERIDKLSAAIISANIEDEIEDAEFESGNQKAREMNDPDATAY